MGFIGDFFLPKHFFRALGNVRRSALPEPVDGRRPSPRHVLTDFFLTASKASQAISDRWLADKGWAQKKIPGSQIKTGGILILLAWFLMVGSCLSFGYSRLLRGFGKPRRHNAAAVAPVNPVQAGVPQ